MILEKKVERELESNVVGKKELLCPLCGKEMDHLMTHLQKSHKWTPWNDKSLKNKFYE